LQYKTLETIPSADASFEFVELLMELPEFEFLGPASRIGVLLLRRAGSRDVGN
jgi:hypothetical protein